MTLCAPINTADEHVISDFRRHIGELVAFVLALLPMWCHAGDFASDFAVVFASAKTEARFGKLPLDRGLLATAIENAARDGAKGVVVKFFLPRARRADTDARLA